MYEGKASDLSLREAINHVGRDVLQDVWQDLDGLTARQRKKSYQA